MRKKITTVTAGSEASPGRPSSHPNSLQVMTRYT